jgi:hypothetical protein
MFQKRERLTLRLRAYFQARHDRWKMCSLQAVEDVVSLRMEVWSQGDHDVLKETMDLEQVPRGESRALVDLHMSPSPSAMR